MTEGFGSTRNQRADSHTRGTGLECVEAEPGRCVHGWTPGEDWGGGRCAANLTWPRPCAQKNGGHARQVWGEGRSELVMWGWHAALNLRMCLGGPGCWLGSQGKLEQQGEVGLGTKEWWILGSIAGLSNPRIVTRGRNSPTGKPS